MKGQKTLFSSNHDNWSTPKELYDILNNEFCFDFDPCPINADFDGLNTDWKGNIFINPPYSNIRKFIEKGLKEREWKFKDTRLSYPCKNRY